jgi:hypothetical protein
MAASGIEEDHVNGFHNRMVATEYVHSVTFQIRTYCAGALCEIKTTTSQNVLEPVIPA